MRNHTPFTLRQLAVLVIVCACVAYVAASG